MALVVYNTMTGRKEPFKTERDRVKMYVCGITPYDDCHIGHARCYVIFDVVRRYLKYRGFQVTYVQNFTDIDDKIIERAGRLGREPIELSNEYIQKYYDVMSRLGIERPDKEPRVTEHIKDIIETIKVLIEKGYAYRVENDVYYSIDKFKDYGKLSHRNLEDMIAGARIQKDQRKHNPFDFALWKEAKPGEPSWDSPWGKGRPGWHIECSVMSMKYLDKTLDIHGGGQDLVFPHHENEIAQSEAYSGKPFVQYWMHNGFVTINKEKMSKSLGNIFSLKDVFRRFSPEIVRLFLISQHYRSPIDFSLDKLEESRKMLERFNAVRRAIDFKLETSEGEKTEGRIQQGAREIERLKNKFEEAMEDDFNTAMALGALNEMVTAMNMSVHQTSSLSEKDRKTLEEMKGVFNELAGVLGLKEVVFDETLPAHLVRLIKQREEARRNKDYESADRIRKELEKEGIILEDTSGGTRWRVSG